MCTIVLIMTCVFGFYTISMTEYPISFSESCRIMLDHMSGNLPSDRIGIVKDDIIWNNYMPRAIGAITIGAILGMSGAAIQSVVRNPMTDSYTTGISSGALFGVTIHVILGISVVPLNGNAGLIANAFVFSLLPCAIIILVSMARRITATMMVLVGIGMMYIFSAFTTLIKFTANPDDLETIYEWNIGTLANIRADHVVLLIVACTLLFIILMGLSKHITVMLAGDRAAQSLGVDPMRIRFVVFVAVSICTAVSVCFAGSIGFVGLVVPHIVRRIAGSTSRILIPWSAVLGAALLLGSDFIAKHLIMGGLPVGVITALIGSPIFLYLLTKSLKSRM